MSKVAETYLYSVMNRRPIKLDCGVEIRSPKSLYLTKEDVLKCLQSAHVYRRFSNPPGKQEQVTIANIDRLHRANYIPEFMWNQVKAENEATIEETKEEPAPAVDETPVVEEIAEPVITEEVVDEVPEEPEVVEDIEVDHTEEDPEEEAELTSADDSEEQDTLEDDTTEDIVSDVVVEDGEEDEDDTVTEDDTIVDEVEEDETGVSEEPESKPQTNNVNYKYNNKKKRRK